MMAQGGGGAIPVGGRPGDAQGRIRLPGREPAGPGVVQSLVAGGPKPAPQLTRGAAPVRGRGVGRVGRGIAGAGAEIGAGLREKGRREYTEAQREKEREFEIVRENARNKQMAFNNQYAFTMQTNINAVEAANQMKGLLLTEGLERAYDFDERMQDGTISMSGEQMFKYAQDIQETIGRASKPVTLQDMVQEGSIPALTYQVIRKRQGEAGYEAVAERMPATAEDVPAGLRKALETPVNEAIGALTAVMLPRLASPSLYDPEASITDYKAQEKINRNLVRVYASTAIKARQNIEMTRGIAATLGIQSDWGDGPYGADWRTGMIMSRRITDRTETLMSALQDADVAGLLPKDASSFLLETIPEGHRFRTFIEVVKLGRAEQFDATPHEMAVYGWLAGVFSQTIRDIQSTHFKEGGKFERVWKTDDETTRRAQEFLRQASRDFESAVTEAVRSGASSTYARTVGVEKSTRQTIELLIGREDLTKPQIAEELRNLALGMDPTAQPLLTPVWGEMAGPPILEAQAQALERLGYADLVRIVSDESLWAFFKPEVSEGARRLARKQLRGARTGYRERAGLPPSDLELREKFKGTEAFTDEELKRFLTEEVEEAFDASPGRTD